VAGFFFDPVAFDSRASPATSLHSICPSFSRRINQAQLKKWPSTFHADDVPHAAAGGSEIGVGVVEGAAALAIMKAGPLIGISPPLGLKNVWAIRTKLQMPVPRSYDTFKARALLADSRHNAAMPLVAGTAWQLRH